MPRHADPLSINPPTWSPDMDKDAIDSIIAALRDAGHTIGAPALDHATTAIQIDGAVGIASGIAAATGAVVLLRVCYFQVLKIIEVAADPERYSRDEEVPHVLAAIASGIGLAIVALIAVAMLTGSGWSKLFSPLGWLIVRGLGV